MKNCNRISLIIFILTFCISCKAQFGLDQSPLNVPKLSYMQDTNNDLSKYVGTWKANFNNKVFFLYISKHIHKLNDNIKIYQDMVEIKYIVKNMSETLTLNQNFNLSFNTTYDKHSIYSFRLKPQEQKVQLTYSGTNCGVGWGLIELTSLSNTQINWSYVPNSTTLTDQTCPPGQDLTIYLPITQNLVFTKQ